jgi:NAD(P)-dependent dehydrogenase (short-subunit alcohol dehydrogenase family)
MLALTKRLARELAPRIRVPRVTSGLIATDEVVEREGLRLREKLESAMSAIRPGRLGTPDDVLRVVEFIVCHWTYVNGQNSLVDVAPVTY